MEYPEQYIERLRDVLNFLNDHGFSKAAEAVYEQLDTKQDKNDSDSSDSSAHGGTDPELVPPGADVSEYHEDDSVSSRNGEYRSRSTEPAATSGSPRDRQPDSRKQQPLQDWHNSEAAVLSRRLSGSRRHYEEPDLDEYDNADDVGYMRREVPHQQEFILQQLEGLRDEDSVPNYSISQHHDDDRSHTSDSLSSSASLTSPERSDRPKAGNKHKQQRGVGDESWDQGPTDITFAEPVTTPTKDSRRSSNSGVKPSLSRVESLSNSFIDDMDSIDGTHSPVHSTHMSEADSLSAEVNTGVIDFQPPPPPPEVADAAVEFGIFELGFNTGSRTSSVDALHGSLQGLSDTGSELGSERQVLPMLTYAKSKLAQSAAEVVIEVLGMDDAVVRDEEDLKTPIKAKPSGEPGSLCGGFSFPVTPTTDEQEHEHEERAERVFSTWASSHSHASADPHGGSDEEGADFFSRAFSRGGTDSPGAAGGDPNEVSWDFPVSLPNKGGNFEQAEAPSNGAVASSKSNNTASEALNAENELQSAVQKLVQASSDAKASAAKAVASSSMRVTEEDYHTPQGQSEASSPRGSLGGVSPSGGNDDDEGEARQERDIPNYGESSQHELGEESHEEEGAIEGRGVRDPDAASTDTGGYSEPAMAPYVIDEAGNILYEYDQGFIDAKYEIFDLKIIHRRRRTGFEDSKEFPIRKNDLIAGRYQVMDFLGSAAFSQAVQALDVASGSLVCLKIIKNNKDYFDQSLDEIKLLRYVNACDPADEHSIVRLYDFFYYKEHLFLVCELLRANLYEFQKYQRDNGDEPYFTLPRIQRIALQVLRSLAFLHSLGLIHSDLKPENILIKSYSRCEVKVIDLGSSCYTSDHLSSYVQSRSYRAPEVILGIRYDQKIDIWSLGCILAELSTGYVLFQNDSLATLLARLEGILGSLPSWMIDQGRYSHRYFTKNRWLYERSPVTGRYEMLVPKHTSLRHRVPDADEGFLDFLAYLLTVDPTQRPTAEEALQHPWLQYPYPPVEPVQD